MSTEDLTQTGLRVGGWLPPYRDIPLPVEYRAWPDRPALVGPPSDRPPRRYRQPAAAWPIGRVGAPLVGMTVLAVVLAGLTVTFLTGPTTGDSAPGGARIPAMPALAPAIPFEPAGLEPSAPPTNDLQVTVARRLAPLAAAPQSGGGSGGASSTKGPGAPAPSTGARLVVGKTIGLELSGHPGYRVRHRDFRGRVDRIDGDSSDLDRADSRFTVRAVRADGCVALESVNYPGRFLRHRNFVLHLDRQDGTALFAADSTFCPVYRSNGALVLRSYNYPNRYITDDDSALTLTSVATGFVVRPPL